MGALLDFMTIDLFEEDCDQDTSKDAHSVLSDVCDECKELRGKYSCEHKSLEKHIPPPNKNSECVFRFSEKSKNIKTRFVQLTLHSTNPNLIPIALYYVDIQGKAVDQERKMAISVIGPSPVLLCPESDDPEDCNGNEQFDCLVINLGVISLDNHGGFYKAQSQYVEENAMNEEQRENVNMSQAQMERHKNKFSLSICQDLYLRALIYISKATWELPSEFTSHSLYKSVGLSEEETEQKHALSSRRLRLAADLGGRNDETNRRIVLYLSQPVALQTLRPKFHLR